MEKTEQFKFVEGFDPVTPEAWRAAVERDLKGAPFEKRLVSRTDDGLAIAPLYTQADEVPPEAIGSPGAPPYTRGSRSLGTRWDVRERVDQPDPDQARAAVQAALDRGAHSLWIQLDAKARAGRDWDHVQDLPAGASGGVMLSRLAQLTRLLDAVDLARVPIDLDAGASAVPAAALLVALCRERGVALEQLRGGLNADPVGALAAAGRLTCDLQRALALSADLASWLTQNAPGLRAFTVSTLPYHAAGATPAQELGAALATGLTYLRAMADAGLNIDQGCVQLRFRLSVGRDVFAEIAKLRAARLCWARLAEASGGGPAAQRASIHACTAWRTKTHYDPWVNLLRGTGETFAAAVGGAEAITTSAFDEAIGTSDDFARRMARNSQIVLQEEAYVARVADPAGGSWYVESLTRKLAEAAWEAFRQLEREGGIVASLQQAKLQQRIAQAASARQALIDKRRLPITGVSEFPNVAEELPVRRAADTTAADERAQRELREHLQAHDQPAATAKLRDLAASEIAPAGALTTAAIDAAGAGATVGRISAALHGDRPTTTELAVALQPRRDAQSFEQLRVASDAFADLRGARPRVFLANMGPIPQHRARSEFSSNLFQAGGFEPVTNDGFESADAAARAFGESKAQVAVICSTDDDYRARAAELARALKQQGARLVVLAGRPGEQEQSYREAGVDHFIFLGCDVRNTLLTLLETLEVIR